jgi:type I restriction enzyme S subunit
MVDLGGRAGKLRDFVVADGVQIGPFGSQLHASDYRETGTPVVMPKDMIGGRITTTSIARVGQDDVARLSRHQLRRGDILLPRRGDLTKRALIREDEEGWLCGTGSIRVRVPLEQSRLVFEAVNRHEASRWLVAHAVGTTMLNLNTDIVGQLPLVVPDLEAARPLLTVLEEVENLQRDADDHLTTLLRARAAVVSALLSRAHVIPDSYDRFLTNDSTTEPPSLPPI